MHPLRRPRRQKQLLQTGCQPFPFVLDPLLEAGGRVVRAPTPADGEGEHLAQHLAHPVGADRGRLRPLQLARAVVGLFLRWPRPALGDNVQQFRDIMRRDFGHQLLAPVRGDQLGQHRPLVGGIGLGQMWYMFGEIAVDHVAEPWRLAQLVARAKRVTALVNHPAQLARPFAGGRHGPFRPAPDGHAALGPGKAVVQIERPVARSENADRKAPHLRVEHLVVPPDLGLALPHGFIVQSQALDHGWLPLSPVTQA